MKSRSVAWSSGGIALLAAFAFLMTSCGGAAPATSSGSLRAWIDQPITGYTLAPQSLTLKAHARQDGGGVTEIHFIVNDTLLANVPTDAGQELTVATTEWNPSEEGWYRIQAVAFNGAGQQSMSEVSRICISRGPNGPCGAPPAASAEVDSRMTVDGSPDPVSIGASCDPADRIVHFTATVPDTAGARRVIINGYLVSASGARVNFALALEPGTTAGSYAGTFDLGTMEDAFLGGEDGTLEYAVGLTNDDGDLFRTSETRTLTVHNCGGAAPAQGVVKVGGFPNGVFIGKCTPTEIDFEAGTDIDPGMFDHLDLAYTWINLAGAQVGVQSRAEMTLSGTIYRFHLDVNTAPAGMLGGGTIRYKAIAVNTDNADIVSSDEEHTLITACGGGGVTPQPGITPYVPVCSDYTKQQKPCIDAGCYYWSDATCNDYPEPAGPTCADYKGQSKKCAAAGCYYWSDSSCNDYAEPPPPSCDSYFKNPDGCKSAGCYYWSDNTCNNYEEPFTPSCDSYLKPDACQAAGCTWDYKLNACFK